MIKMPTAAAKKRGNYGIVRILYPLCDGQAGGTGQRSWNGQTAERLSAQDVADVLGIGLAHAYEVAHRQDFPTITLGSRIIVPRDKFMAWIEEQAAKKTEIF